VGPPWQLTTKEFFTDVRAHLAEDGVVIINVGRTQTDWRLVEAMTATLLQVLPTVHTNGRAGVFQHDAGGDKPAHEGR